MMLRSKRKNEFNKERSHINWYNFNRQHNRCLNILRKPKKGYFNNLNIKQVLDNKLFWKNIKKCFSDKGPSSSKITLVEWNDIVSNEKEIGNTMNDYFTNVTKTLNLKKQFSARNGDRSEFDCHKSIKIFLIFFFQKV